MTITTSGFNHFDDFIKQVKELEKPITFDELFSQDFMLKHTDFSSFDEFLQKSDFHVESAEEFNEIPEQEMNVFVVAHTKFAGWNGMQEEAWSERAKQQLGL